MRALVIAAAVGLLVTLLAHTLGVLLFVLGLSLVVIGIVLTMTAIGAVIGIPLGLLGVLAVVFGAIGTGGTTASIVLGTIAGLLTFVRLERRQTRTIH
jgi:hypothetical protein